MPRLVRSLITGTVLLVGACAIGVSASGAPTPTASRLTAVAGSGFGNAALTCAWPVESTPTKANVAYPDSNAVYWTTPFVYSPGMTIVVSGTYPTARYVGFDVYGSDAQTFSVGGVASAISDFQVAPNAGSQNPWQTPNATPGGSYTVTLSNTSPSLATNTIPIAPVPAATPLVAGLPAYTGFLMMRAYLPEGGNNAVALPNVTINDPSGTTRTLTPCASAQTTPSGPSAIASRVMKTVVKAILGGTGPFANAKICTSNCPPDLQFSRAGGATTPFPNAVSGYAAATYQPAKGYITVVRATMPTSAVPYGSGPGPWTTPAAYNLRYWSVCNYIYHVPFPVVTLGRKMGCQADQNTALTATRTAVVVLSSASERPAITRVKAAKMGWLPYSTTNTTSKEVVAIRNMLPSANADGTTAFAQSVTNIATYSNAAQAKAVMQQYYPRVTQCTTATFARGKVAGCFANPASPPAPSTTR